MIRRSEINIKITISFKEYEYSYLIKGDYLAIISGYILIREQKDKKTKYFVEE